MSGVAITSGQELSNEKWGKMLCVEIPGSNIGARLKPESTGTNQGTQKGGWWVGGPSQLPRRWGIGVEGSTPTE